MKVFDDDTEESALPHLNKKKNSVSTSQQPIQEDETMPSNSHLDTKQVTLHLCALIFNVEPY